MHNELYASLHGPSRSGASSNASQPAATVGQRLERQHFVRVRALLFTGVQEDTCLRTTFAMISMMLPGVGPQRCACMCRVTGGNRRALGRFGTDRTVREYRVATEMVEAAGSNPNALEEAMERFERATVAMDRVGGWDAETFAQQV